MKQRHTPTPVVAALRRVFVTAAVAAYVLACAHPAGAVTPTWGPALDLGTTTESHAPVRIAIAPDGYAVAAWDQTGPGTGDTGDGMYSSTLTPEPAGSGLWTHPAPDDAYPNLGAGGLQGLGLSDAGTATLLGYGGARRITKGGSPTDDGNFGQDGSCCGRSLAVASSGERAAVVGDIGYVDGPDNHDGMADWSGSGLKPADVPQGTGFYPVSSSVAIRPGGAASAAMLSSDYAHCCSRDLKRLLVAERAEGASFGKAVSIYTAPAGATLASPQMLRPAVCGGCTADSAAAVAFEEIASDSNGSTTHSIRVVTRGAPGWGTPTTLAAGTSPRFASAGDGTDAALTFIDPGSDTGPARVMLSLVTAETDFAPPVAVNSGTDPISAVGSAFMGSGGLVVAWIRGGRVYAAVRPPGSSQFGNPTPLSDAADTAETLDVAGGPEGDAIVVWSTGSRIQAAQLGDTGTQKPPACFDGRSVTEQETSVTIHLDCTDPNGDILTLSIAATPSHGSLDAIDEQAHTVKYTPALGYFGPDSFKFRASDGQANSPDATETLTVGPKPTPPQQPPNNNNNNGDQSNNPPSSSSSGNPNPSGDQGCAHSTFSCDTNVHCPGGPSDCTGSASDQTNRLPKAIVSGAGHVALIHTVHFKIPAGKKRRIRLKLTHAGITQLRRKHKLNVKVGLTVNQGAKTWHSVRTLRFRVRPPKHAHH